MKNYVSLGNRLIKSGIKQNSRIGPTRALHNQVLKYDLTKGFPLMTTKFVGHRSIITETIWYLQGTESIKYLEDNKVFVWSQFADENKSVGKTYSYQFRNFGGVDQVKEVIKRLTKDDDEKFTDRRAIINLFNTAELDEMSIPPCIATIQFNVYWVKGIKYIDATINQRSADFCLGVPYDIAEMALLTHIIGAYVNARPKNMAIFYSNIHVYEAHVEVLKEQLKEEPKELPTLIIDTRAVAKSEPENIQKEWFIIIDIPEGRKKFSYELF